MSLLEADCVTTAIICPPSVLLEDIALSELGIHSNDSLYQGVGIGEGGGAFPSGPLRTPGGTHDSSKAYQLVDSKSIGNSCL